MAHQFNNLFHQHQIKGKNNHYLNFIYPQQVLTELRKSNFTLLNQRIQFDDNGDPKFGSYSIVFWNHNGEAEEIGYYKFYPSVNFFINSAKIQWYNPGEVTCFSLLCAKVLCVSITYLYVQRHNGLVTAQYNVMAMADEHSVTSGDV